MPPQVGGWSAAYAGGRIGSAIGAKAGMATAIALGQAGPQVATPEEVVTVPVFGVIGGIGGGGKLRDRPCDCAGNCIIFACYSRIMRHFKMDTLGTATVNFE